MCGSHHFNADPAPDLDPAPHQSDSNLRPLVYRLLRAPLEPRRLHCECQLCTALRLTLMRMRTQLPKIMRMRIRNHVSYYLSFLQHTSSSASVLFSHSILLSRPPISCPACISGARAPYVHTDFLPSTPFPRLYARNSILLANSHLSGKPCGA